MFILSQKQGQKFRMSGPSSHAQVSALRDTANTALGVNGWPAVSLTVKIPDSLAADLFTSDSAREQFTADLQDRLVTRTGGRDFTPECTGARGNFHSYMLSAPCKEHGGVIHGVGLDFENSLRPSDEGTASSMIEPMLEGMHSSITLSHGHGGDKFVTVTGSAARARRQALDIINSGAMPDSEDPVMAERTSDLYKKIRKANEFWARRTMGIALQIMHNNKPADSRDSDAQRDEAGKYFGLQKIDGELVSVPASQLHESTHSLYLSGALGTSMQEQTRAGGRVSMLVAKAQPLPNVDTPGQLDGYVNGAYSGVVDLGRVAQAVAEGTGASAQGAPMIFEVLNHFNAYDFASNGAYEHKTLSMEASDYGSTPVVEIRGHHPGVLAMTSEGNEVPVVQPLTAEAAAHDANLFSVDYDEEAPQYFHPEVHVLGANGEEKNVFASQLDEDYISSAVDIITGASAYDDPTYSVAAMIPVRSLSGLGIAGETSYNGQTLNQKIEAVSGAHPIGRPKVILIPKLHIVGSAMVAPPLNAMTGFSMRAIGSSAFDVEPLPGGKRYHRRATLDGEDPAHADIDRLVPVSEVARVETLAQGPSQSTGARGLSTREWTRYRKAMRKLEDASISPADREKYETTMTRLSRKKRDYDRRNTPGYVPMEGTWLLEDVSSSGYSSFGDDTAEMAGASDFLSGESATYDFPFSQSYTQSDMSDLDERIANLTAQMASDVGDQDASSESHSRVARVAKARALRTHKKKRRATVEAASSRARNVLATHFADSTKAVYRRPYGNRSFYRTNNSGALALTALVGFATGLAGAFNPRLNYDLIDPYTYNYWLRRMPARRRRAFMYARKRQRANKRRAFRRATRGRGVRGRFAPSPFYGRSSNPRRRDVVRRSSPRRGRQRAGRRRLGRTTGGRADDVGSSLADTRAQAIADEARAIMDARMRATSVSALMTEQRASNASPDSLDTTAVPSSTFSNLYKSTTPDTPATTETTSGPPATAKASSPSEPTGAQESQSAKPTRVLAGNDKPKQDIFAALSRRSTPKAKASKTAAPAKAESPKLDVFASLMKTSKSSKSSTSNTVTHHNNVFANLMSKS